MQAQNVEPRRQGGDPVAPAAAADVFMQLGALTRQLHDTLQQLGVMPQLRSAVQGLPDARGRLAYITQKTAAAADQVLTSVERAKAEQQSVRTRARALVVTLNAQPANTDCHGAILQFVAEVQAHSARVDQHLTDIMLAQDFHDLTGQVVAKVVTLASELEDSLVKLLVQTAPTEPRDRPDPNPLDGPVIDAAARTDVVSSQREVDELLASLGF